MYAAVIIYALISAFQNLILFVANPTLLGLMVILSNASPLVIDQIKYPINSRLRLIIDAMFYNWCSNIIHVGDKYELQFDDLNPPRLEDYQNSMQDLQTSWLTQWNKTKNEQKPPSNYILIKAIFWCYWRDLIPVLVFLNIREVLGISAPFILGRFVKFADSYQLGDSIKPGVLLLIILCVEPLVNSSLSFLSFARSYMFLGKLDAGLGGLIYWKSLNISPAARENFSSGELLNMWTGDRKKIQYFFNVIQVSTYAPISLFTSLYGLHELLGASMWAGFATTLVLMVINSKLNSYLHTLQQRQTKYKEDRLKVTNEILSNMETIKYNVWESFFLKRLSKTRQLELNNFRYQRFLETTVHAFVELGPYLVAFASISSYTFLEKQHLRPEILLPASLLFAELRSPLINIANIYNEPRRVVAGLSRIQKFLMADNAQDFSVNDEKDHLNAIEIENSTLKWCNRIVFDNISHNIKKGSFTCIVGKVGTGKSSFLRSLIGDMEKSSGTISIHGSIAYASQSAWIKSASVKENIIFGSPYDKAWYEKVIYACALDEDIKYFVDYDETLVGEKGIALSGGQRARIGLARAVYARADICLVDDPLSAVDEKVGKHIVTHIFGRDSGLLKNKTVVMATHTLSILNQCSDILVIHDKKFVWADSYETLKEKFPNLQDFLPTTDHPSGPADQYPIRRERTKMFSYPSQTKINGITNRKPIQTTSVNFTAYANYISRCGKLLFLCLLVGSTLNSLIRMGAKLWIGIGSKPTQISWWSSISSSQSIIYLLIGLSGFSARMLEDVISFNVFHIPESFRTYMAIAENVIRSKFNKFESKNKGYWVDRFTEDIVDLDEKIPDELRQYTNEIFEFMISIAFLFYSSPYIILAMLPLILIYHSFGSKIVIISKNAQKLVPKRNARDLSRFQESIDGSSHIRAFNKKTTFLEYNREQTTKADGTRLVSMSVGKWFEARLQPLNSVIALICGLIMLKSLSMNGEIAIPVGIVISNIRDLYDFLMTFSYFTAKLASISPSLERLEELLQLETECEVVTNASDFIKLSENWPSHGEIVFDHYSKVYHGKTAALQDIVLNIKPGEKIGIVGRTGAGKSSLVASLFRIREASAGRILIDGVDISKLNVYDLRQKISIILQEPKLPSGTVRESVDPSLTATDEKIWKALESSHIADFIKELGGLDATVAEGGSNFSVGQCQLLCISRALLSEAKIIVLDEATASVDLETSRLIQLTVEKQFRDKTVLTIAHRLTTIINCDRVIVLDAGIIVEFDTPNNLLETEGSRFKQLWDKSHEA